MTSTPQQPDDIEIDVQALRKRYAEERAKRLRPDAGAQYSELTGRYARFDHDPNADDGFTRPAMRTETEVLIIGGGYGGLLAGAQLRENGVHDICIVEKGADFGGTWYWNRYPGAACDVESYIYLPMLEELGYMPARKYATAPEIFEHCRRLARHFSLYDGALFQTEVTGAEWDEQRQRWIVATSRGDEIAARYLISCIGLFSRPKMPGIPGIESFRGHSFHTARWDFDYTGGDASGGLTGLADKTVGIIGTESTAVQCVPHLGQWATTGRPIRNGQRRCSQAGSTSASPISPPSPRAARATKISCMTAGPTSSATSPRRPGNRPPIPSNLRLPR
jgi:cyclohexanone monooxygenase